MKIIAIIYIIILISQLGVLYNWANKGKNGYTIWQWVILLIFSVPLLFLLMSVAK